MEDTKPIKLLTNTKLFWHCGHMRGNLLSCYGSNIAVLQGSLLARIAYYWTNK
jgi:hypothetical protein